MALRDADHDGHAETIQRFGTVYEEGKVGGGTGITVYGDALYIEVDQKIVRYLLSRESLVPKGEPETIREFARLDSAVEEARLQVPIAAVYQLAQAAKAHARLEKGHVLGRIVLQIRP